MDFKQKEKRSIEDYNKAAKLVHNFAKKYEDVDFSLVDTDILKEDVGSLEFFTHMNNRMSKGMKDAYLLSGFVSATHGIIHELKGVFYQLRSAVQDDQQGDLEYAMKLLFDAKKRISPISSLAQIVVTTSYKRLSEWHNEFLSFFDNLPEGVNFQIEKIGDISKIDIPYNDLAWHLLIAELGANFLKYGKDGVFVLKLEGAEWILSWRNYLKENTENVYSGGDGAGIIKQCVEVLEGTVDKFVVEGNEFFFQAHSESDD